MTSLRCSSDFLTLTWSVAGAVAVRYSGVLLFPIYFMLAVRTAYFLLLLFVVPESLSPSRRRDERLRCEVERAARREDDAFSLPSSLVARAARSVIRQVTQGFAPLAVLLPRKLVALEEDEEHQPMLPPRAGLAPGQRDWSLTYVAAAFFVLISVPGIVS